MQTYARCPPPLRHTDEANLAQNEPQREQAAGTKPPRFIRICRFETGAKTAAAIYFFRRANFKQAEFSNITRKSALCLS